VIAPATLFLIRWRPKLWPHCLSQNESCR